MIQQEIEDVKRQKVIVLAKLKLYRNLTAEYDEQLRLLKEQVRDVHNWEFQHDLIKRPITVYSAVWSMKLAIWYSPRINLSPKLRYKLNILYNAFCKEFSYNIS